MQSDYAKTQDEILKIQENIMKGYNAPVHRRNHIPNFFETYVSSNNILQDTLTNKFSYGKGQDTIGLCQYPQLNKIYGTNKKLFNIEPLTEKEIQNGLDMNQDIDLIMDQLEDLNSTSNDCMVGEINLSQSTFDFVNKDVEKISTLPSISKPEYVINKQIKVYISFEHFFLDQSYPLPYKVYGIQHFQFTKEYFQQFLGDKSKNYIKVYKNEELPIWGVNVYTDDSNPLSILRHCAVYEKIEEDDKIIGCKLVGFNKVNGFHALNEPIEVFFDGLKNNNNNFIKPRDFIVTLKYMPTLSNYYGSNLAFERNGVMPRNWYGSQFLSAHDGLSIAIWDIECIF
ncbi:hypothetical protein ACO0R3_001555 [Hanseniaspora guilliermondii]